MVKIEDIQISKESATFAKIRHKTFARVLLWLDIQFEKAGIVMATELSEFLSTSYSRAFNTLEQFVNLDIIFKEHLSSNFVHYKPVMNNSKPIIKKYVPYAKKTLGLK